MLRLGEQNIKGLYLGEQEIKKAYLGENLVFEGAPIYNITATISPDRSGTVSGAGSYKAGARVTLKADPEDGYKFTMWKELGETRLPNGYTELEYIEASKSDFTCINTGRTLSEGARYVIDFELTAKGGTSYIKALLWADGTNSSLLYQAGNGSHISITDGGTTYTNKYLDTDTSVPKRLKADIDIPNNTFTLNGTVYDISSPSQFSQFPIIMLMGNANANYSIQGKLYSYKSYENSALVQELVPCSDPSGNIGLYNLVNGSFYANAGTGAFTAGPEVDTDVTVSEDQEYTFTVSGDRTLVAVFEAVPASRLPEGYTEVEYIRTDRSRCGFDTGVRVLLRQTRITMEIQMGDYNGVGYEYLFRVAASSNPHLSLARNGTATVQTYVGNSGAVVKTYRFSNEKTTIEYTDGQLSIGGEAINQTTLTSTPAGNLFLLASTRSTYSPIAKLYSAQIYENGTIIRDFVPCIDLSGVVGLYDLVESQFYRSAWAENPAAGPTVEI